jgi:cytochrome c oxidase cbb3-type subunit II
MFDSKASIFLGAGLGFFFLAFLANAVVPALMYAHLPEQTVEEMIDEQLAQREQSNKRGITLMTLFEQLREQYADQFKQHIGAATKENLAKTLRHGRKIYIGEGCWHCHSQFVRPVSNEERRWGPVAKSWEYQNELQRPVLFGTRRVGPDLSREGGRRSNDWHAVHFYQPKWTSPQSVMPEYPWFFEGDPGRPNDRGLAIITYMQWLGSWLESYPRYDDRDLREDERP